MTAPTPTLVELVADHLAAHPDGSTLRGICRALRRGESDVYRALINLSGDRRIRSTRAAHDAPNVYRIIPARG